MYYDTNIAIALRSIGSTQKQGRASILLASVLAADDNTLDYTEQSMVNLFVPQLRF